MPEMKLHSSSELGESLLWSWSSSEASREGQCFLIRRVRILSACTCGWDRSSAQLSAYQREQQPDRSLFFLFLVTFICSEDCGEQPNAGHLLLSQGNQNFEGFTNDSRTRSCFCEQLLTAMAQESFFFNQTEYIGVCFCLKSGILYFAFKSFFLAFTDSCAEIVHLGSGDIYFKYLFLKTDTLNCLKII